MKIHTDLTIDLTDGEFSLKQGTKILDANGREWVVLPGYRDEPPEVLMQLFPGGAVSHWSKLNMPLALPFREGNATPIVQEVQA